MGFDDGSRVVACGVRWRGGNAATDTRLRVVIEGVSRQIDAYCNRHFYVLAAIRIFDSAGGHELLTPDLVSIDANGLKTDDDKDRTFETTWAAADYLIEPPNADPTGGHDGSRPYSRLVVDTDAGNKTDWPAGRQTVQAIGQWGYWQTETQLSHGNAGRRAGRL